MKNSQLIDLTYELTPSVPHWSGNCGFNQFIEHNYEDCQTETKFRTHQLEMLAGVGTHIDAPLHCFAEAKSISELDLKDLFVPCVVIDIPHGAPVDYRLSVIDIGNFESRFGKIPSGCFILIRTGWGRYWHDPLQYRNNLLFPTVSSEAAELLLNKDMVGLGIDTLSPDNPKFDFPVHQLVLGAGKYIIENVANAESLPSLGAWVCALPIKLSMGTEAPIRMIGIIDKP